jgi:hypothetical protein
MDDDAWGHAAQGGARGERAPPQLSVLRTALLAHLAVLCRKLAILLGDFAVPLHQPVTM